MYRLSTSDFVVLGVLALIFIVAMVLAMSFDRLERLTRARWHKSYFSGRRLGSGIDGSMETYPATYGSSCAL